MRRSGDIRIASTLWVSLTISARDICLRWRGWPGVVVLAAALFAAATALALHMKPSRPRMQIMALKSCELLPEEAASFQPPRVQTKLHFLRIRDAFMLAEGFGDIAEPWASYADDPRSLQVDDWILPPSRDSVDWGNPWVDDLADARHVAFALLKGHYRMARGFPIPFLVYEHCDKKPRNWASWWVHRDTLRVSLASFGYTPRTTVTPGGSSWSTGNIETQTMIQWHAVPDRLLVGRALANAAFFLVVSAVTMTAARTSRCAVRTWRGRCMSCGYPLDGLADGAVCPECGRGQGPDARGDRHALVREDHREAGEGEVEG